MNDVCDGAGACAGTSYSCPGGTTCAPVGCDGNGGCVTTYASSTTWCGDCHCGEVDCDGQGSCRLQRGCLAGSYECP